MTKRSNALITGLNLMLTMTSDIALAGGQPFLDTLRSGDTLLATQDSFSTARLLLWAVKAASVLVTTFLVIRAGKLIHLQAHYEAFWTFVGAVVAGASAMVAEAMFLG